MSHLVAMTASLPMYDLPGLRDATDAWWAALRDRLRGAGFNNVPQRRTAITDRETHWTDPKLVFSQTCGFPLLYRLGHRVQLVATPVYDVEGCDGPHYSSVVLVRAIDGLRGLEDLRGLTVAFNGEDSQSGYNCLRSMVAPLARAGRFFGGAVLSGAHLNSAGAVAAGDADVCAVDCVTWQLARQTGIAPAGLTVLAISPQAPALPYITSAVRPPEEVQVLRDVLSEMCSAPELAGVRESLRISGVAFLDRSAYQPVSTMHDEAIRAGYPVLA